MAGLDKRLAPGEQIYHHLHPHAKALVVPVLVLLLVCGGGGFLAAVAPVDALRWIILVLGIALVVAGTVRPFLRWLTTTYTVTDRRIILRNGILSRNGRDVPLNRITDVAFRHSPLQRLFGCGTLMVESASENGQVVLADVPRVETVQRDVYVLVDDAEPTRGGRRPDPDDDRDDEQRTTVLPRGEWDGDEWDEDPDEDDRRGRRRGRRR